MKLHSFGKLFSLAVMLALVITIVCAFSITANAETADAEALAFEGTMTFTVNPYYQNCGRIRVTWDKVEGTEKYVVYKGNEQVAALRSPYYNIKDLEVAAYGEEEIHHIFKVVAVDKDGNILNAGYIDAVAEHKYEDIVTPPNCTEEGYTTHLCECGDSYVTDTTKALGHEYTAVVTAPTCTEKGYTTNTCIRNDHSYITDETPALGHTEATDEAVAPTCTETGLTKGKHCSVCNEVLVAQETVDALGHDEIPHDAKAPTCTEKGWDAYVTCSRCDYTTYNEKSPLGHDEIPHDAKAPTCTEIGWDAYVACSRCDYTTYNEKSALGHDETTHDAKAPTCTEKGWDAYVTCSRCDYTTYVEKSALGHDEVTHEAKDPTCAEIGWDAYVTCSRCDYTTYVEKSTLAHTNAAAVKENVVDPTCTENGSYDTVVYCSVCSVELKREAVTVEMISHDFALPAETDNLYLVHELCTVCSTKGELEKVQIAPAHKSTIIKVAVVLVCAIVIVACVNALIQPATTTPWYKRGRYN